MRVLQAVAILLMGPLFGLLIALLLGALAVPPDPNFAANGSHAAPGDGFLILPFIFVNLIVSVPISVFFAVAVLLKKARAQTLNAR